MQRHRIRVAPEPKGSLVATLVLGLGLGVAAGFLAGELFAGRSKRGLRAFFADWRRRGATPTAGDAARRFERRAIDALGQDGRSIDLIPVGHSAIEVSGWVSSRAARSRALRLAREAFGPDIRLVDSLLVWGEDDGSPTGEVAPPDEDLEARPDHIREPA